VCLQKIHLQLLSNVFFCPSLKKHRKSNSKTNKSNSKTYKSNLAACETTYYNKMHHNCITYSQILVEEGEKKIANFGHLFKTTGEEQK
jgi:hypothetical protein